MQVFLGDSRVGDLDCPKPVSSELCVRIFENPLDEDGMAGTIWLSVEKRTAQVDNHTVEAMVGSSLNRSEMGDVIVKQALGIPRESVAFIDHACDMTRFKWDVLSVSLDQYEMIFDLDTFTPA